MRVRVRRHVSQDERHEFHVVHVVDRLVEVRNGLLRRHDVRAVPLDVRAVPLALLIRVIERLDNPAHRVHAELQRLARHLTERSESTGRIASRSDLAQRLPTCLLRYLGISERQLELRQVARVQR